jgi:hypothetical protein
MDSMVIGSSGRFDTGFPPNECGQRLNSDRSASSYVGHADGFGFQLAKYGRTAVRIRGTFTPHGAGSQVHYQIEFIPAILWWLALAFTIGIPLLLAMAWLHHVSASTLIFALVIVGVVLPINIWFSEQQANWLKDYVIGVLDVRVDTRSESRDFRPLD